MGDCSKCAETKEPPGNPIVVLEGEGKCGLNARDRTAARTPRKELIMRFNRVATASILAFLAGCATTRSATAVDQQSAATYACAESRSPRSIRTLCSRIGVLAVVPLREQAFNGRAPNLEWRTVILAASRGVTQQLAAAPVRVRCCSTGPRGHRTARGAVPGGPGDGGSIRQRSRRLLRGQSANQERR